MKKEIAELLLDIKAVILRPEKPFRYASGILSPIYCDNRMIISYPEKRDIVRDSFIEIIRKHSPEVGIIAGTATAGIPHAALIADTMGLPMIYVRSSSKGHGRENLIEGRMEKGENTIMIEDLVSTGGSSVRACKAVRENGGLLTHCYAIFTYGMKKAEENFAQNNITLHTLSDFSTLVDVAYQKGYITDSQKETVMLWNKDPEGWGKV
ncbi:MAG: orotate phosphoribosyltransferase [Candidatus Muiribacteriaceae bacterium]